MVGSVRLKGSLLNKASVLIRLAACFTSDFIFTLKILALSCVVLHGICKSVCKSIYSYFFMEAIFLSSKHKEIAACGFLNVLVQLVY